MSDSYVKADFSGLDKLLKNIKTGHYVDVGILKGGTYDAGQTVASVGASNEFGVVSKNIPPRSFIKMPLEEKAKNIQDFVEKGLKSNVENGNIKAIFEDIGVASDSKIQEAFETKGFGKWQENADYTKNKKNSDSPLIDTGLLRKSISYKVGGK